MSKKSGGWSWLGDIIKVMFTGKMYERLSEWTANISVLFVGSSLIPFLSLTKTPFILSDFILGILMIIGSLWLSLRLTRFSERRNLQ